MESALNGRDPLKRLFEASLQVDSGGPVRTTGLFEAGGVIYAAAIASLRDLEGATGGVANAPMFVMVASRFDDQFLQRF
ncbi:MAG: hypothetical protein GTO41_27575, partial [Burkholderiales bacterium]|nr:hypothetical protein [Burkholderiales bacterium]